MKPYKIALAGNPNSGKSAIFNALTGLKQHVGNWPGVTVEKKSGSFEFDSKQIEVIDLPGTYSLKPYSLDEEVSRDFLYEENPDLTVVIVDASNLERNLYLVVQLLEMESNLIVCLNMMDIAEQKGVKINRTTLSNILGVPVVETIANQKKGVDDLKERIVENLSTPAKKITIDYGRDIEETITEISKKISIESPVSERFFILNVLEDDEFYVNKLNNTDKKHVSTLKEKISDLSDDIEEFIVERRYAYVHSLTKHASHKILGIKDKMHLTEKIDKFLLNRFLGFPLFLLIMWLTFQLVFELGGPVADIMDESIGSFGEFIGSQIHGKVPVLLASFIVEGVIGGVGSVIVFLPILFILFTAISILEDSGYMSRAAFLMDRFMHFLGLHGKSFIPMILGFGCSIPAIMSCRTFENQKDRIITILVVPFMSCAARLPIYTLFAGIFFPEHAGSVIFSLYFLGIIVSIIMAKVLKTFFFKEEVSPLIMELPPYHLPQWPSIFKFSLYRCKLFLKKAGTLILGGVVLIWLLASMPFGVEYASSDSVLGHVGGWIAPILEPAGFGNWQSAVALAFGVLAKEIVVGTFGTLLSANGVPLDTAIQQIFTPLSSYAFMVMCLIYFPCVAAVAVVKQEIGSKWAVFSMLYTTALGWFAAVCVYQIGSLLGLG